MTASSTSSNTCSSGLRSSPLLVVTLSPPGAPRSPARLGGRDAGRHLARARDPCAAGDAGARHGARPRVARAATARRSSNAPPGSPSTRSRRCACSSSRGGWSASTGPGDRPARSPRSWYLKPSARWSPLASTRSPRPTGRSSSTPPSWAAASRSTPSRRSSGRLARRAGTAPPWPRPPRAPGARRRPAQPGPGPVRIRPGARPGGRLWDPRPGPTAGPTTSPPPATWSPSVTDEVAGALAAHYLAAYRDTPAGHEADALATQARITLTGAARRALDVGAHDQAVAHVEQALPLPMAPGDEAALLEIAARATNLAGDQVRRGGATSGAPSPVERRRPRRTPPRPPARPPCSPRSSTAPGGWRTPCPFLEAALARRPPDVAEEADAILLANLSRGLQPAGARPTGARGGRARPADRGAARARRPCRPRPDKPGRQP